MVFSVEVRELHNSRVKYLACNRHWHNNAMLPSLLLTRADVHPCA
tara:strand:+ start:47004 stop:47138 length:135 start_codon:yes stop_codon:yes gene_type:complete